MSYKVLQLSPQASTRSASSAIAIKSVAIMGPWDDPWGVTVEDPVPNAVEGSSINWGAVSGLAISVGLCATFWAGIAIIVARIWG